MSTDYIEFQIVTARDEDGEFVEFIITDRNTYRVLGYADTMAEAVRFCEEFDHGCE